MSGPGHAAPPPPPGPFVLGAAAPAGEARGGAGRGRRPGPAAFFVCRPGPRRCPSASRVQRREQRAAPRGRPGAAGRVPSPPGTPSAAPISVDYGLFPGGSRDVGSLRWVGGSLHKAAGRENKPSRCGERRPGAASRPISADTIHPPARRPPAGRPAGSPRQSAGLRGVGSAPRGRWVGATGPQRLLPAVASALGPSAPGGAG